MTRKNCLLIPVITVKFLPSVKIATVSDERIKPRDSALLDTRERKLLQQSDTEMANKKNNCDLIYGLYLFVDALLTP